MAKSKVTKEKPYNQMTLKAIHWLAAAIYATRSGTAMGNRTPTYEELPARIRGKYEDDAREWLKALFPQLRDGIVALPSSARESAQTINEALAVLRRAGYDPEL